MYSRNAIVVIAIVMIPNDDGSNDNDDDDGSNDDDDGGGSNDNDDDGSNDDGYLLVRIL